MKVTASTTVSAPRSEVFAVFADIEHAAERIAGITKLEILSETKSGLGLRWRETRTMFGKEATEEMEMTVFEEPTRYVVEAESHGTHYTSTFEFGDGASGSCDVSFSFEGKPLSIAAKLFTPLGYLFKGSMRKMLLKDMTDLKSFIEGEH